MPFPYLQGVFSSRKSIVSPCSEPPVFGEKHHRCIGEESLVVAEHTNVDNLVVESVNFTENTGVRGIRNKTTTPESDGSPCNNSSSTHRYDTL